MQKMEWYGARTGLFIRSTILRVFGRRTHDCSDHITLITVLPEIQLQLKPPSATIPYNYHNEYFITVHLILNKKLSLYKYNGAYIACDLV